MAKQASLAAQGGALTQELKLPAVFQAPQEPLLERFIAPYLTWAHNKRATEWAKINAQYPGTQEHDFFLVEAETVTKLDKAKLGFITAKQFWFEANAAGEVLRTSFTELPFPWKEGVEAVVLVYLDDRIVPANVLARTVKTPAIKDLGNTMKEAMDPSWGDKSPAHKESLVCNQPFMRYYGIMELGPTQISKTSGLPYRPTIVTIQPTSVQEWRLLKAFTESAEVQKQMDDAARRYQGQLDSIKAKLAK